MKNSNPKKWRHFSKVWTNYNLLISPGKVVSLLASPPSCSQWPTFFMCFPGTLVFQQCCSPPPGNRLVLEEEITRHSNKLGELSKHTHVILLCFILHCCARVLAYLPAHLLTRELPACEETANWKTAKN